MTLTYIGLALGWTSEPNITFVLFAEPTTITPVTFTKLAQTDPNPTPTLVKQ